MKLTFSGHETFHCRQFWLKKAFDFTNSGNTFAQNNSSLELGVGKNMVAAIKYWSKCFQMVDNDSKPSEIATALFDDDGWDPFLEDFGSLWLLHMLLVSGEHASTVNIIFNELIKERPEFSSDTYLQFVTNRKEGDFNQNSLKKDFTVFYRMYFADFKASDIEESFTGILTELNLLKQTQKTFIDKDGKPKAKEIWVLDRTQRNEIPAHILLYSILQNHPEDRSIGFEQLYNGRNEIGSVFALSKEGLTIALERIVEELDYPITFNNQAGIRELQIKQAIDAHQVLEDYYAS